MITRRTLRSGLVAALAAGLAVGAWFAWRGYTTPAVPQIDLAGAEPEVVRAVEAAREQVRQDPRSGAAWGRLATVLQVNGLTAHAGPCFDHAERFDPADPRWPYLHGLTVLEGDRKRGVALFRRALDRATNTEDRAVILFRLALVLLEDQQLDEADQALQALRAIEPDGPRVSFGLGLLAVARDDRAEARHQLTPLAEHPAARRQVCAVLATLEPENPDAGRKYLERAARLPRDKPWPDHFEDEALRAKVDRLQRIAKFWELKNQGRYPEALDFLRRYVAGKADAEASFILGCHLFARSELDEAERMLRDTIRHDPANAKARLFLGEVLYQQAERQRAAGAAVRADELFRETVAVEDYALTIDPTFGLAHLTRGKALKGLGRTAEALLAFRAALRGHPHVAEVHLALGETLAESGQVAEGLEHLANAVQIADEADPRPRAAVAKWQPKAKAPE